MKKFIGSIWAKTAAYLIACICATVFVGCAAAVVYCADGGVFNESGVPFRSSSACYNFVEDKLETVKEFVYWNDIEGLVSSELFYDDSSFSYKIVDGEGKSVVNTLGTDSLRIVENYRIREVDSYGNTVAEYTAAGCINLPIMPGDSAYSYYLMYTYSGNALVLGVACAFVSVVCFIFLMVSAGKNSEGETVLVGLNRVPWDLFAAVLIIPLLMLVGEMQYLFVYERASFEYTVIVGLLCILGIMAFGMALCMSMAARLKVRGWWKNSIIYKILAAVWHFIKWFVLSIPQTWLIILIYCAFVLMNFILAIWIPTGGGPFMLLILMFFDAMGLAATIWFALQLKSLKKAGEAIASGDFDYKVSTIELWPGLREHGANLNSAAAGMSKALEARMKSERFKTELITNVSHDLKTPLTSIVSYVDLLKKEDIQNETARGYIEVLDRQSAKLKKLTEDLVEASKASSGAIAVSREKVNIGELVNQSVGEFTERLEAADITPVVNIPEEEVPVYTDGRLLWRVFDNLIQNIIKYAQPGTRAYFDLTAANDRAVIVMKNISREPLNMSADALMERFVRGDSSRGETEGNGLGLSIAKSLTELCGGTFELLLDGDLYKAVVSFPVMKQQ